MSANNENICYIEAIRLKLGYVSQSKFAKDLKYTRSYYSSIVAGIRKPTYQFAKRLSEVTQIDLNEIVKKLLN